MASETTEGKPQQPSPSYKPHCIFTYSISHLAYSDKVRFHYALKGRGSKSGVLQRTKAESIGRAVLLVSQEKSSTVETFLNEWKCVFQRREVFITR